MDGNAAFLKINSENLLPTGQNYCYGVYKITQTYAGRKANWGSSFFDLNIIAQSTAL